MKVWLVISEDRWMKYGDRYKIFISKEDAIKKATEFGYKDSFGSGVIDEIGKATIYKSGELHVVIIPLELEMGNEINKAEVDSDNFCGDWGNHIVRDCKDY